MKIRKQAHLFLAALALLCCLMLTGCNIAVAHHLDIQSDGTATATIMLRVPELLVDDDFLDSIARIQSECPEWELSSSEEDGFRTYTLTTTGDLEELRYPGMRALAATAPLVDVDSGLFSTTYTINAPSYSQLDASDIEEVVPIMRDYGEYFLSITLPKEPDYHNSPSPENNGQELCWDKEDVFRADGSVTPAKAEYTVYHWFTIILAILIVPEIVVILIIVLIGVALRIWEAIKQNASGNDPIKSDIVPRQQDLDVGQPEAGQPEAGQPEEGQPEAEQSEGGQPEAGKPESSQSEAGQPEAGQPEAGQTEGDKTEP